MLIQFNAILQTDVDHIKHNILLSTKQINVFVYYAGIANSNVYNCNLIIVEPNKSCADKHDMIRSMSSAWKYS